MASFKQENGANEVGTQVTTMKTITGIQLHEPSVFDNYKNHPCRKELKNGCVNVNTASSQILENIFQLYIEPMGTRHIKSVITIYIYIYIYIESHTFPAIQKCN